MPLYRVERPVIVNGFPMRLVTMPASAGFPGDHCVNHTIFIRIGIIASPSCVSVASSKNQTVPPSPYPAKSENLSADRIPRIRMIVLRYSLNAQIGASDTGFTALRAYPVDNALKCFALSRIGHKRRVGTLLKRISTWPNARRISPRRHF